MKISVGGSRNYIKFNTNQDPTVKIPGKTRVLVAPLDWGLGHATRCIPVINELLDQGWDVWLAGDREVKAILSSQFPELPFLFLKGYGIHYSKKNLAFTLARQIPKLIFSIREEHRWLIINAKKFELDCIISDNRFGLYHPDLPCIFITHQLEVKSLRYSWLDKLLRTFNYRFINRFSRCWIPDNEGMDNIAGELSHPSQKPATPLRYIGIISRLTKLDAVPRPGHLVIILSGPEPQRTIFENLVINQLVHYNGTADVLRGLPSAETILPSTGQLKFYNHLPPSILNNIIAESTFVISRSGYTSVMDLIKLEKKCILIPTPGQTEQEYLATYLMEKKFAYCVSQAGFSLESALQNARNFEYRLPQQRENHLSDAVKSLLSERR